MADNTFENFVLSEHSRQQQIAQAEPGQMFPPTEVGDVHPFASVVLDAMSRQLTPRIDTIPPVIMDVMRDRR